MRMSRQAHGLSMKAKLLVRLVDSCQPLAAALLLLLMLVTSPRQSGFSFVYFSFLRKKISPKIKAMTTFHCVANDEGPGE